MARRFDFKLEAVRTVRRQTRDAQRRVVGEAARAVAGVEERIARLNQYLKGAADQARALQRPGPLDLAALKGHQMLEGSLKRAIEHSSGDLSVRQQELRKRQADLAQAAKELKVIEKLRDRQWALHRVEVMREEQQATDEAAVVMYLRQSRIGMGSETAL